VHHDASFVDMYRLLNLEPGCDLAQFKQAYRRRVAVLHPDRPGVSDDVSSRTEQLTQLTRLYAAALVFERRHGRLPGAPMSSARAHAQAPGEPVIVRKTPATGTRATSRWQPLALLAVIVTLVLAWHADWFAYDVDADSSTPSAEASIVDRANGVTAPMLNIGMDPASVRRIEGDPILIQSLRWDYGPSWVLFENGIVVDWYSAPSHPLKTPASRPQPAAHSPR
jgi:hypothetical protein